ncbi:MAG TPA: hypothetical protein VLE02_01335 [Nitrosarchaeum sp.]|nr:hypothetical protein [Nitrosarchaeum sp.]
MSYIAKALKFEQFLGLSSFVRKTNYPFNPLKVNLIAECDDSFSAKIPSEECWKVCKNHLVNFVRLMKVYDDYETEYGEIGYEEIESCELCDSMIVGPIQQCERCSKQLCGDCCKSSVCRECKKSVKKNSKKSVYEKCKMCGGANAECTTLRCNLCGCASNNMQLCEKCISEVKLCPECSAETKPNLETCESCHKRNGQFLCKSCLKCMCTSCASRKFCDEKGCEKYLPVSCSLCGNKSTCNSCLRSYCGEHNNLKLQMCYGCGADVDVCNICNEMTQIECAECLDEADGVVAFRGVNLDRKKWTLTSNKNLVKEVHCKVCNDVCESGITSKCDMCKLNVDVCNICNEMIRIECKECLCKVSHIHKSVLKNCELCDKLGVIRCFTCGFRTCMGCTVQCSTCSCVVCKKCVERCKKCESVVCIGCSTCRKCKN